MQEGKNCKLIILDRDGVINQDSDEYIKSPAEWIPLPGSLAAIARLNAAGYVVTVATNQSGIGRGYYDFDTLDEIHEKMHELLAKEGGHIDDLTYCPHLPDLGCQCRKPAPGMLDRMVQRFDALSRATFMIGDTLSDYQAAMAAGVNFVLLRSGKGLRTLEQGQLPDDVPVFDNLAAYVDRLLEE